MIGWLGTPEFKVGALVVTIGALIGAMSIKVAEGPGVFAQRKFYFKADSAGGLVVNSAVKMAGIKVGVIKDIILEDGRAKIVIALEGDTDLTESTRVELKSDGILGDRHVELLPGSPEDIKIKEGSEILLGDAKGGLDDVMSEVSRVAKSMNELMATLNKAAKDGDETTSIGRIIRNIELVSRDFKDITGENKEKINEIVDRIRNVSKNIDTYLNADSMARLERSLQNIEEITAKINKGEGTLGRLINDEHTVDELNSAITNVNKFLGGGYKMETSVDFHSEFLNDGQNKSFLGMRIQPGLDRFYEVSVISDTVGVKRSTETHSVNDGVSHDSSEETTYKNKFKLTALFAKNFWDLTLKGGLIENSGGVGIDYHLFNKSLVLSTEFFQFSELQIRAFARYSVFRGVYVIAGGDNLLSKDNRDASPFVGAGIFITNDDLKLLATKLAF